MALLRSGFPLGTGNRGKMGRDFPAKEKSDNFKQTGKVREESENHAKYWKIQGISEKCYLLFLAIFQ